MCSMSVQEWSDVCCRGIRSAHVYILVYDICCFDSFEYVKTMRQQILETRYVMEYLLNSLLIPLHLYIFALFSLSVMLYLLMPSLYFWSIPCFFFLHCFISCMFLILLFLLCLMVCVITLKRRDPSVIMGCQHTGSFLHHLDPSQKKFLFFSSADCKGHHQKSIQKPQRLFALYLEQVWWWCLIVAVWAAH